MLNVENKNEVTEFLNDEQIRELAPTVFQTKPSNEVSKYYTHIPTIDVVNDMRKLGWDPKINVEDYIVKNTVPH